MASQNPPALRATSFFKGGLVKKTLFEKEGGIARSAMTGDLRETNSNPKFVSTNPPALRATSFFKGG
ncbi:MAG: hypothetical protein A2887_00130 [Alphaproteobacteria bacterium RIFCSPLOWO2_01_FULL_40_26]|nr:MAG: hypothetical protein A3D15_06560 [Alphaproteobacteria bacterium RIFCSPHIGHO2_02_FULL_40_34]OFW94600.1 MAG: hypothetical protein A2887_00130 [Alphaproteobacteria bacterium RIFCSPLOWO2_01_FULL_40_26]OFX10067.1 MAG: hypothetical protein A3H30_04585 [Alphaproteobacteria bacterium RIFCSPLOWO2_02_FULL_40_19]OFX11700.1 MAG: hypothetical protein A3G22_04180 [Alphaproteobacteria bacterium RIFCSPLOWO2_12_FULL_40_11]